MVKSAFNQIQSWIHYILWKFLPPKKKKKKKKDKALTFSRYVILTKINVCTVINERQYGL